MGTLQQVLKRHPRGSALFLAMMMVTLLASMTLFFAERIASNEARQESDTALSYALELAESANDWNVERVYRDFDAQYSAQQQASNDISPIDDYTQSPFAMLDTSLRRFPTTDANSDGKISWLDDSSLPSRFDYIKNEGMSLFNDLWNSPDAWVDWGPGQVKLSATQVQVDTAARFNIVEFKARARVLDALSGQYIERQVKRVVRYTVNWTSEVFNFAYFANNYGWMYGSTIYIHGNMGSNGNLGFKSGPTVNGMLYAARNPAIGADGRVLSNAIDGNGYGDPTTQDLHGTSGYYKAPRGITAGDQQILPMSPAYTEDVNFNNVLEVGEDVNSNGIKDQIDFSLGYKGKVDNKIDKRELQAPLDMPYLGDLSYYKSLANSTTRPPRSDIGDAGGNGGVIKQLKAPGLDPTDDNNYNYIVGGPGQDAVYGNDPAENGKISSWETSGSTLVVSQTDITTKLNPEKQERNGNLALIGTPQQPIVISGPVVITGDLAIRGTVKGQGTFFVGRNTHVMGDVVYSDPPTWRNPSDANSGTNLNNPNFSATAASNQEKDLVGFAAKGSIVLGQYYQADSTDYWKLTRDYFKTGFQNDDVQAYQVDPTDEAIGYVTDTTDGKRHFHGDYLANVKVDPNIEYPSGSVPTTLAGLVGGDGKFTLNRYDNTAAWDNGTLPTTPLKYYESVFSPEYMKAFSTAGTTATTNTTKYVAPGNALNSTLGNQVIRPGTMMGIYYTNHLFGGRTGGSNGIKFYGTMVCRDEGVVFSNKCVFVYDPRVSDKEPSSHVEIFAPTGTKLESISWEEMTPGQ